MRYLPSLVGVATLCVAQILAQNPVVTDVVRLGDPTTTASKLNFLAMFDQPVNGVGVADFAPITNIPGAFVASVGNNGVPIQGSTNVNYAVHGNVANFPSTGFTIEFFYSGLDLGGYMLDYETGPTDGNVVRLFAASAQTLQLMVNGTVVCTGTISGGWANTGYRHFAAKWDSATGEAKIFIGGSLVGSGTGATGFIIPSGGAMCLGSQISSNNVASPATFSQPLHGDYDEFRLWNFARSDSDIINNRLLLRTGDESGLALYWSFDTYEDLGIGTPGENDIRDLTGNGHHPTFGPSTMPPLVSGHASVLSSRHRVTVRLPADICPHTTTVGLQVLNDGTITATSGGLPLAAPFSGGETYQRLGAAAAMVLPGTNEDFTMAPIMVNGNAETCALAGELVVIHVSSPGGEFNWSVPIIAGQAYLPGAHPGSSFPGINFNITLASPFDVFLLFDGNAAGNTFFGPYLLQPSGLTIGGFLPAGLAGLNVMFQGIALNPGAANMIFASTEGREVQLR